VLAVVCSSLIGCGGGISSNGWVAVGNLRGTLHGGRQPIIGAKIQLYAAGTTGYGSSATPLLASPVTSDETGSFSITGDYTCPSSTSQLYIVGTGGNPGLAPGTNNPALALMAALGPCSLHGSQYTLDPNSFISINEVTTVASVYALAAFMGADAAHLGTSSTNAVGLANSFQTVNNLVNPATGAALSVTPAGNGTAPQTTINTLANIVASCVNSDGTGNTCRALAAAATPSGGTTPTDTIQDILNVARNPANNVNALYALANPKAPFQPTLGIAPNDWTLTLNFSGNPKRANALAIDASGNIWIVNEGMTNADPSTVTEFSNAGVLVSGSTGFIVGGIPFYSDGIAIDPAGNVWVEGHGNGQLVKLSNNGTILSGPNGYSATGMDFSRGIAIDGSGNAWVTSYGIGPNAVFKFASDGTVLSGAYGFTASGMNTPTSVAVDAYGKVWITNYTDYNVTELSNSGGVLSGTTGFTGNGLSSGPRKVAIDAGANAWILSASGTLTKLNASGVALSGADGFPVCIQPPLPVSPPSFPVVIFGCSGPPVGPTLAIDGAGNVWVPFSYAVYTVFFDSYTTTYYSSFAEISNSGAILSGPTGYASTQSLGPVSIGIDSSGNIWGVRQGTGIVEELIGVATPVVTPLSAGVKNNTLGTRP
jgi:hypothetical protein